MISPHTKPGTKVLCVDADRSIKYNAYRVIYPTGMDGLSRGSVYTVEEIIPYETAASGFVTRLKEIERPKRPGSSGGFDLQRFRYLELPSCLTELLHTVPTRSLSELEPTR